VANTYFKFKNFTIEQEKSSMKVCTDSCLFGAWVAEKISSTEFQPKAILDIGTGTGLLSLMLAQKTEARIDAIEIDKNAFEEASRNFKKSPWNDRLDIHNVDIKNWSPDSKYDFIICNPPFFENDLRSPNTGKNISKHQTNLRINELLKLIPKLLIENGTFSVLLPSKTSKWFVENINHFGFFASYSVHIKQSKINSFFRSMFICQKKEIKNNESVLTIKDEDDYTPDFRRLLNDYYLHF
jgi:tRNA1Val (adenine37-N6)-methyltransferase